jgi:hypothetical protein
VSGKAITTLDAARAHAVAWDKRLVAGCAASAAAWIDVQVPHAVTAERDDDPGRRSAGDHEAPDRGADPHAMNGHPPLRDISQDPDRFRRPPL